MAMADDALLSIEVACALPHKQTLRSFRLPAGVTARAAVMQSGLQSVYPAIDFGSCPIGVFGRVVADDHALRDGDRVEVYRPLVNEPRDARRKLAAKGATMGTKP